MTIYLDRITTHTLLEVRAAEETGLDVKFSSITSSSPYIDPNYCRCFYFYSGSSYQQLYCGYLFFAGPSVVTDDWLCVHYEQH